MVSLASEIADGDEVKLHSGSVIGIDVGCSQSRRSSAICRLDWSEVAVSWEIERFRAIEPERQDAIIKLAGGRSPVAAALDGPIRRGFDIIGRYRSAERMLTRRLRPLIGKPGQSSTPVGRLLNQHANACAQHLIQHSNVSDARHEVAVYEKAIVEAFPSSFLGLLLDAPERLAANRGNRSDLFFQHLAVMGALRDIIEHCIPGRKITQDMTTIVNHDDRAGFVCALTALCVAAGSFTAVGDGDGWIILPPTRMIRPEQLRLLLANGSEEPEGSLRSFEQGKRVL